LRVIVAAVGRLRDGPEAAMTADYLQRAAQAGRQIGFKGFDLVEVEGKPPGDMRAEAAALFRATPDGARKVLLDERGAEWTSRQLAERLARWRDDGVACTTFWIGGADGASKGIKDNADEKLAFGRQTWPHRLVRVMISEQVYRAVTILCSTPYHRD
jgi:23S rRNA (pseudouridine1915-N3)-methyltransferase